MKRKLRYATRVGSRLFREGTEIELLNVGDPRVTAQFPLIPANSESNQVAAIFPGRTTITIIHKDSIAPDDGEQKGKPQEPR